MSVTKLVENKSGIESAAEYAPLVTIYADASCIRNGCNRLVGGLRCGYA